MPIVAFLAGLFSVSEEIVVAGLIAGAVGGIMATTLSNLNKSLASGNIREAENIINSMKYEDKQMLRHLLSR